MSITVRKYKQSDFEAWDKFVDQSNNGTLFHFRSFLNYHIERKFNDHSLIFEKKGKLIALFSAAVIEQDGRKILHSHPGASYGGFIHQKINFSDAEGIIDSFEKYLSDLKFTETFFIPTPSIYSPNQDETMDYALLWRKYEQVEFYISSVITIHSDVEKNRKEV